MKRYLSVMIGAVLFFGLAASCYADERSYVWTYEYKTVPQGTWEAEYYLTSKLPDTDKTAQNTLQHWWELEYGITPRWDISMYQMLKYINSPNNSRTEYEGFKIRTRYRFFNAGEFIVDPLIYLEYIRNGDFHQPNVIEAKLVLAKDIGKLNVSYNQIIKRNLERQGKTAHEYAVGASYEVVSNLRLGIESKGDYSAKEYAIGPSASLLTRWFWVSIGGAVGLNDKTDDVQARMIVGVPF